MSAFVDYMITLGVIGIIVTTIVIWEACKFLVRRFNK